MSARLKNAAGILRPGIRPARHRVSPIRGRGFTLIELLVAVAMISVLAAVAIPGYRQYVARGYRAQAKAALLQVALWMERAHTANGVYPEGDAAQAMLTSLAPQHYVLQLRASTASSYTVVAVRRGPMQGDICGDLTLTHTGVRGAEAHRVGNVARDCWGR